MILPILADDPAALANARAWEVLATWQKPVLTLFSAAFAGSAMGPDRILAHLPGAGGQDHALLPEANFYITEDQGPELARRIAVFAAGADASA
jgi:haloalkane dehalogenase